MRAVNLIPGDQRQGVGSLTGRSSGAALMILGLFAGLAVMLLLYGSAHHTISSQRGEVGKLEAEKSAVEARTGRLAPYKEFVSMADQRAQTVAQLVATRFDWSHAMHELGRVLPSGTALSNLHGTVGASASATGASVTNTSAASAPASSTPAGSTPTFTLGGCATSQAVVAQTLQRLRLIDGVSEVQLQSSTKSNTAGSSASGGCPAGDPSFTVQIVFAGLPTASAASSAASSQDAAAHGTSPSAPGATVGKQVSP